MLSIIIITKNEEKNLPLLLASLRSQDYKDYEIIVSDAESTDRTVEIAEEQGCRVIEGGLPSVGRNNGAQVANGEILLFLDADVILPNHFLTENLKEFNKGLDGAGAYVAPINGKKIYKLYYTVLNTYMKASQYFFPHTPGLCIFVKKNMHEGIGGFDPEVIFSEDSDYVNRISKKGRFRMLKSKKIHTSVRRFEKDGHLKTGIKYLAVPLYRGIFGEIKTDIFNYQLGHYDESNSKNKKSKDSHL